jgi:hypothetical protein
MRHTSRVLLACVLCGLVGACTSGATTTTAARSATTSTQGASATTSTTALPEGVDAGAAQAKRDEVAELIPQVEALRGLPFLVPLDVTVDTTEGIAARIDAELASMLPAARHDAEVYELLGLLDPGSDPEGILRDLYETPTPAYYDASADELVVDAGWGDWEPYDAGIVVHELVHALGDQHFRIGATADQLAESGGDQYQAFQALVEGDATYFQLLYLQSLSPETQAAAADAALDQTLPGGIPAVVQADLGFLYQDGVTFVEQLVASGGIAAVDRAYVDPPDSTEQILHPERYEGGESARQTREQVDVELTGYAGSPVVSLGEWRLGLLMDEALTKGQLAQASDGWNGDSVKLFDGGTKRALAYVFAAASDDDAIEVTQAIVSYARDVLHLGDGVDAAGGILFDASPFFFVDRIGDGLRLIVADDEEAGRELMGAVRVP